MNLTSDNLQRLLAFPFRGPDWPTRLGIGALLIVAGWVIPIVPWLIVTGYAAQIARRVAMEGAEPELPAWTDWSAYLIDGFKVFAARFVMALPFVLVFMLAYGLIFGGTLAGVLVGEAGGSDTRELGALVAVLSSLAGTGLFLLAIPLILAISLVLPVPSMHVIVTGQIGAIFRFGEWWPILRADIGAWAIGYLLLIAVGLIINLVTSFAMATIILCFVLPFVMIAYMVYSILVTEVVFAQAYRSASQKLATGQGYRDAGVPDVRN